MTERLYYDDAYLTEFDAQVTKVCERNGRVCVALDRSAFYPTSGGQPFDRGSIAGCAVTDVYVDGDGEVWHEIDGRLAIGDAVHGSIDWERRFDHMQQHGGEHMIAGAIYELTGGMTIGLHLGAEVSTIDVEFADGATHISEELVERIEDVVNERIQRDWPVRCWFPDAAELAALPLRKQPTVKEHVRIVAMGDFEMVACGGTHPSSTGQIGLVKIVDTAPARGKLRVSFVCGRRAYMDYRRSYRAAWAASKLLATNLSALAENIAGKLERLREAEHALGRLRREMLFQAIPAMLDGAETLPGGGRLVCKTVEADAQALRELASELIGRGGVAALLAAKDGEKHSLVFARSADLSYGMGKIMSEAARACGGKGGGRPDFAQGGGSEEILWAARDMLLTAGNE